MGSETLASVILFWKVFIYLFDRQLTLLESNIRLCFVYGSGGSSPISILLNQGLGCCESSLHAGLRSQPETWRHCFSGCLRFWYLSPSAYDAQGSGFSVQKDGRVYIGVLTVSGLVITKVCFQCKFMEYYSSSLLKITHSNFYYLGLTTNN